MSSRRLLSSAEKGFVEEQHPGLEDEGAGERQRACCWPPGQLRGELLLVADEADALDHLADAPPDLLRRPAPHCSGKPILASTLNNAGTARKPWNTMP